MRAYRSPPDSAEERLLETIRDWVIAKAPLDIKSGVPIRGMWGIRCNFQPRPRERKFSYQIVVSQTTGQGVCYYDGAEISSEMLRRLIGRKYRCSRLANRSLDIALLDSVAASIPASPDAMESKSGSYADKALWRASLIANEVRIIAEQLNVGRRITVCNLGVVSLLVNTLLDAGHRVRASDFDSALIGRTLFSTVRVADGRDNERLISEADIAVVTGMALATRTLAQLIKDCQAHGTRLVVFAETGAHFAPFYVQNGIEAAIAEPFPFYTFDGSTQINIYRKPS